MKEEIKKFWESVAKVFGMDGSTVISLFNDDGTPKIEAAQTLIDKDKARIKKIADDHASEIAATKSDVASRVKKEERSLFEEHIKSKFNLKTDKVGLELIDLASEESKKSTTPDGDQLTEQQIKSSKLWIEREAAITEQLKTEKEKAQKELTDFKSEVEQKEVYSQAEKNIIQMIKDSGAVLPDEKLFPEAYAKQLNLFLEDYKKDRKLQKIGEGDASKIVALDKEGKPILDEHKNSVDFSADVEKRIAGTWPIEASKKKTAADPVKGAGNPTGKKYSSVVPKVAADSNAYVKDIQAIRQSTLTPEDKRIAQQEYIADYKAANPTS